MKKTLLFCMLLAAAAFNSEALAQNVTLNVKLHPIQTILVNASQRNVDLDYITKANYQAGVSVNKADHLSIYSTGGFAVKVTSLAALMKSAHASLSTQSIELADVLITPSLGTGLEPLTGATLIPVYLSTDPKVLISNTTGGIDKNFSITYAAAGAGKYVNKYFSDESPTTYTTTVTYTIEAL